MSGKILQKADELRDEIAGFLVDIVKIKSYSGQEKQVIERIEKEMNKVGFDEVKIDGMGNIIGRVGNGKKVIAMDAHIDTVEVGNPDIWKLDPFSGETVNGIIHGRGACDQKAGMASMVYGVKIMKELDLLDDFTLYITGTVMEEDCDGLCWQYIVNEDKIKPDCVVITEPTNLNIYRGHRGRIELQIKTTGMSCHASAPERGENAIYKMSKIINEIEKMNENLDSDEFLGKGTIVVTQIFFQSPSHNAVPDECRIQLDRRLTAGETREKVLSELEEAIEKSGEKAEILELEYSKPSYTGKIYPTKKYFPSWTLPEDHEIVQKSYKTFEDVLGYKTNIGKWTFSTNGTTTAGMFGIPTVGFGPANEIYAHSPEDQVPIDHLVKAAAVYAALPKALTK
ncbi:MAG: YgeY family selenium metabolism-linked hydrolase [Kosmotoga sp.]|nr:MAG: YgeY family selenium metabolism-linked hydrolase [Kosmotoga sp.]